MTGSIGHPQEYKPVKRNKYMKPIKHKIKDLIQNNETDMILRTLRWADKHDRYDLVVFIGTHSSDERVQREVDRILNKPLVRTRRLIKLAFAKIEPWVGKL